MLTNNQTLNFPTLNGLQNLTLNELSSNSITADNLYIANIESNKLKIVKVLNYPNNNRYILNTMPNVSFAKAELLPANKEEEYHEVKAIIDMKVTKGLTYYEVHWEGLVKAKSTWEPSKKLLEDGLANEIKEFHKELKEKNKQKKRR
jgi:hypothetical protein